MWKSQKQTQKVDHALIMQADVWSVEITTIRPGYAITCKGSVQTLKLPIKNI